MTRPPISTVRRPLGRLGRLGLWTARRRRLGFASWAVLVVAPEVARIQERKLSIRDKIAIERDGETAATVHKALVGIRDRFAIDVEHGANMRRTRELRRSRVRDRTRREHGRRDLQEMVSRAGVLRRRGLAGEDAALILAITVAIGSLTGRDAQTRARRLGGYVWAITRTIVIRASSTPPTVNSATRRKLSGACEPLSIARSRSRWRRAPVTSRPMARPA